MDWERVEWEGEPRVGAGEVGASGDYTFPSKASRSIWNTMRETPGHRMEEEIIQELIFSIYETDMVVKSNWRQLCNGKNHN